MLVRTVDAPSDLQAAFWILVQDTERRFDDAVDRLAKLHGALSDRLEERSYRTFVDLLALLTANARLEVAERAELFNRQDAEAVRRSFYKFVRNLAEQFADKVESPLRQLEAHRSERIELFAGPMSRLAKQTLRDVEVVFLPSTSSLHKLEPFTAVDAGLMLKNGAGVMRRELGETQILRLRYPAARSDELFQHAVFAHELAHAVVAQPLPGQRPGTDPNGLLTWDTVAAGQLPPRVAKRDRPGFRQWFTELACDVLAMRLIGPAFAVAYAEVTAVHRKPEPDRQIRKHPAPELRFAVLREELERFCPLLPNDVAAPLRAYAQVHEGTHGGKPPPKQIVAWLRDALERFRANLPAMLGGTGAEYLPAQLERDLPVVRDALARGAYPAERIVAFGSDAQADWSVPLDWRSILNGTLLDHLARRGAPSADGSTRDPEARDAATRFAAGGIELSELHRRSAGLIAQAEPFNQPMTGS
jgi:hypothetical protein